MWLAGGAFAVAAVLSAGGRFPGAGTDSFPAVGSGRAIQGDQILGTRGHDVLQGSSNAEMLFSFGGIDQVSGGDGDDLIDAGNGEDVIDAGPGRDRIRAFDRDRDTIRCGPGEDLAYVDDADLTLDCEELIEARDLSAPPTPDPPSRRETVSRRAGTPSPPIRGTIVLEDESWSCNGPVDLDLVKVRVGPDASGLDAVTIGEGCTGRIGRVEVDTWSGDGIKVQNAGAVAHDLVVESGYVRCHATSGGYHQDGVQVMGGHRLRFRNLTVQCGGAGVNAALFIAKGGSGDSPPTDIVFENGRLGPGAAHTVLLADSERSGVRSTVICPGRYTSLRVRGRVLDPILDGNRELGGASPVCKTK